MDAIEIRKRIAEIEKEADDDERAHGMEDDLYYDVVKAIAEGRCVDAKDACALLLETKNIVFSRWCG